MGELRVSADTPNESAGGDHERLSTGEITPPPSLNRCDESDQRRDAAANAESPVGAVVVGSQAGHDGQVRASQADECSAAFSFFSHLTTRQLRKVLKEWRWKQSGNKSTLAARAFLHLQINKLSGKTAQDVMATNAETRNFESWLQHKVTLDNRSPLYLTCAPNESDIFSLLELREVDNFKKQRLSLQARTAVLPADHQQEGSSGAGATSGENAGCPGVNHVLVPESHIFSISEFARLCIIMRDDEDAKAALAGTGEELTRSQIDSGFTRDSYWGVIADRFNDRDVKLYLNLTGHIDDVDSSLPPPCQRSASFLKDKFLDAKRSYTEKQSNWATSGQNDHGNFKSYAGTRNGELTAEGKRNMVIFVCARMGTANEDTRFTNLFSRAIPFGRGCDEGGTGVINQNKNSLTARNGRRKSKDDTESAFQKSLVRYSEVATADREARAAERMERVKKRKRTEWQNLKKGVLEKRQWAVMSMISLAKAMKSSGVVPDTSTFEECAKMQMEELRKAFMMPQQSEGFTSEMPESAEERASSCPAAANEAVSPSAGNTRGSTTHRPLSRDNDEDQVQHNQLA